MNTADFDFDLPEELIARDTFGEKGCFPLASG